MSFVGCVDALQVSYTCRECHVPHGLVIDTQGGFEVCRYCGLKGGEVYDFSPYAMGSSDETTQHPNDERSSAAIFTSAFREVVEAEKGTLLSTKGVELNEDTKTPSKALAAQKIWERDNCMEGFNAGKRLIEALIKHIKLRLGDWGDTEVTRLTSKTLDTWYQYCCNLIRLPRRGQKPVRFFLRSVEAAALTMSNARMQGRFVDPDMVIDFVYFFDPPELGKERFKQELSQRLTFIEKSDSKTHRAACHAARAAIEFDPPPRESVHAKEVLGAAENAIKLLRRKKRGWDEEEEPRLVKRLKTHHHPLYEKAFTERKVKPETTKYLVEHPVVVGALLARSCFLWRDEQREAETPSAQQFRKHKLAFQAKQFGKQKAASRKVTRKDLVLLVSKECTTCRVNAVISCFKELEFDLKA